MTFSIATPLRRLPRPWRIVLALLGVALVVAGAVAAAERLTLDRSLRARLSYHSVTPLDLRIPTDTARIRLGQALFFDKELSGNRDTSCATCHQPTLATSDARPLSAGTGGSGVGPTRVLGIGRQLIPRNAPEMFNRGAPQWETMFWDGRISAYFDGLTTPAGGATPPGLETALAAQALFPITSRDEMRGLPSDRDVFGRPNELGAVPDGNFPAIWQGVMDRLLAIPAYQAMFQAAFPDVPLDQMGIVQFGNALAAFEVAAFSYDDSPWYAYVAGDNRALTAQQKRGALVFYGEGRCAQCHTGSLMTDQRYHNIGVPQLGPGKNNPAGLDFGRFLETEDPMDKYAFRTPPLANVALTAPYMHNGAYATLEAVVRHHLDPRAALVAYDPSQLPYTIRQTYQNTPTLRRDILATLDGALREPIRLSERQIADLLAFLDTLTTAGAQTTDRFVPHSVPSGLPVRD